MKQPPSMTSADLRNHLYQLNISQQDLARLMHYSCSQINTMCRDRSPIPETVAIIIRLMLEVPGIRNRLFPEKPPINVQPVYLMNPAQVNGTYQGLSNGA